MLIDFLMAFPSSTTVGQNPRRRASPRPAIVPPFLASWIYTNFFFFFGTERERIRSEILSNSGSLSVEANITALVIWWPGG